MRVYRLNEASTDLTTLEGVWGFLLSRTGLLRKAGTELGVASDSGKHRCCSLLQDRSGALFYDKGRRLVHLDKDRRPSCLWFAARLLEEVAGLIVQSGSCWCCNPASHSAEELCARRICRSSR